MLANSFVRQTLSFAFFVAISVLFSFCLMTQHVSAQGAGASVSPAMIDPAEKFEPGTEHRYDIEVKNLSAGDQLYYLFPRDITGISEGGAPIFAPEGQEVTGYELSEWITLDQSEINVPAGGVATYSFTLRVPENAAPGSHFGGVFISAEPPKMERSGAAVGYQVATIMNIRVAGDVVEEGTIRQFSTSKFLYGSQNVAFDIRIENQGNVLIRPIGPLKVTNMLGKEVGTILFNESGAGVFPGATRQFTNVVWEGDSIGFGRYEALLSAGYGQDGRKTMSSTVTFWILPMNIIGPALGVLATVLLIAFVGVRLYIKRSLAHLQQGRRIVRRRRSGGSSATLLLTVVLLTVTVLFLIILLALFA